MAGPGESGESSLVTFRRKREMTATHAALWFVVLSGTAADVVLTTIGLRLGLQEGNVVVHAMIAQFGLAGLWLVKFLAMCWLVAGWALLSDRNAAIFLGLFGAVTLAIVFHNLVLVFA